jgi:hypothetical protein
MTMSAPTAFPLTWPPQFGRAKTRERGAFKTSLAGALKNVQDSLRLFATDSGKKLDGLIISSNVSLGESRPTDPGVAVWFAWDGLQVCIAVDRYTTVEGNLQAIHHILEARRVELRHGTLALVRATFTGFLSLPAPAGKEWWQILGVPRSASRDEVQSAYKKLAGKHHPDRGGDVALMADINAAYEQASKETQP